jgi:hypothetical protein
MPEELSLFDRALIFVFQVLGVSGLVYTAAVVFLGLIFGMVYDARAAYGHDGDPSHDEWYMSLKQPDNPNVSCCGIADAYWCDDISVKDGKTFCALTDDRHIAGRPDLPMGLKIEIPDRKLKWEQGGQADW